MGVGLLTDRINDKLEKSNLIKEHALNREPVPLSLPLKVLNQGLQSRSLEFTP